jgi:hypothetical protein
MSFIQTKSNYLTENWVKQKFEQEKLLYTRQKNSNIYMNNWY